MNQIQDEWLSMAELARLEIDDAKIHQLAEEAEKMRKLFQTMAKANVETIEPTTHVLARDNRVRKDHACSFDDVDRLVEDSSGAKDGFFLIPKVL